MVLRIGPFEMDCPVVLAALSGYSDWPMRALAKRMGAPYTICEVMIEKFVNSLKDREKTRHFLMVTGEDHPAGAQLMGSEPRAFASAAVRLVKAGFDVIDINFGCPMKKQGGLCRGGLHLGQPDVALQILKAVRDAVPLEIPVTVKMRRGIDDTEESRTNFFRILEGGFDLGIAAATIHGRTVEQKYVGPSRWEFLKEVRQKFPDRVLLGSGDLFTAADCLRMLSDTGVDGVTAARGAIGNPWIFQQARALLKGLAMPDPPTLREQAEVFEEHYRLCEQAYSAEHAARQMRKFCIRYSAWHPEPEKVRRAFVNVRNSDGWRNVLRDWYLNDLPGQFPSDPGGIGQVQSECE
ncbi:MAG: tRNA-dihydrouridine synthase [Planctomyces sp.]|nr:tRNA-dihydrouridine synthase [Planctomyces sp.]